MKHRCVRCRRLLADGEEGMEYAPDPYDEDVNGDKRKVWECGKCRDESAADI